MPNVRARLGATASMTETNAAGQKMMTPSARAEDTSVAITPAARNVATRRAIIPASPAG
ncbi:hypothetical protein ACE7GA_23610 [Roseomonas sp. CCTCC AB2023176]|uniref:hypothetical protein n=1 Tax=Roseomonas sp. CCTCC AB2023176 TaxID=3342640 RepID=UPI0035D7F583